MTAASGQWTLGVLVGLPALGLFLIACGVVAFLSIRKYRSEKVDPGLFLAFAIGAGALALIAVIGALFAYWPLKSEYHQYRAVDGTVKSVANRLVSAGDKGGSNQKFVITLVSGAQQYGVEDTRAALLKPGDTVHLRCIRSYEYGSNSAGYDCKWGAR